MSNTENKIVRIAAAYHNKLIAEKDIVMSDLAAMSVNVVSSDVIQKIEELSNLEAQIETIRKHFGDKSPEVKNEERKPKETSGD